MTIDQIIALSASVGAFFSAIATLLTIRQMKQQREASYRPELIFSRCYFSASKERASSDSMPTNWVQATDVEGMAGMSTMDSIPLRNVGMGAAKSISISWSFPIEEMMNHVNDLAQKTLTPAHFTLENGVLSLKSESLGARISLWKNQQQEYLDYVLPASIQKDPIHLKLPHAFMLLSSALPFLFVKDKEHKSFPEIPSLRVQLEYHDIGNKRYSVLFEIKVGLEMISSDGTFNGYLESTSSSTSAK